jgi:hypothetical protein
MKNALLAAIAVAVGGGTVMAQTPPAKEAWKPVEGGMMTRWARDVDPKNPLPEYPRPTMVREKWMSLNGVWDYAILPPRGVEAKGVYGKVLVPFPLESSLSGVGRKLATGERLEYTRVFTLPEDWKGHNVLLHFGAVNWECRATVNGHKVGSHSGGYDPFTLDITKSLKAGENTIVVEVWNPGNSGGQPRGKQFDRSHAIWYTASSGIWQTVWLEPVPDLKVDRVEIAPDRAKGTVRMIVRGTPPQLGKVSWLATVLLDGEQVASLHAGLNEPADASLAPVREWSPESPTLYDVRVQVMSDLADSATLDDYRTYFAFRDVAIGKDDRGFTRLLLNGKPVFHYGPLDQGYWPDGLYTAPTDEALKSDIIAAKRMGCNMIRKHVKVEPERWYHWCDKLGVMVWQDMPSPFFKTKDFDEGFPEINDKWKLNFELELRAMIDARRSHPCIVMWVPFNEGWGQQDMAWAKRVAESVKTMDPTRLVNNATGWSDMGVGDTRDIHNYPEPAMVPIERDKDGKLWGGRAAVLGEFGGLGLPLDGHTWVNKDNWGYRTYKTKEEVTDAYVGQMQQMPALIAQGLSAAVYTQTTDVEIECNGWLTYDREVWKIDPEKAKAATLPMYGPPPTLKIIVPHANEEPKDGQRKWQYTTSFPDLSWYREEFRPPEDWQVGDPGFGKEGTPGAHIGSFWTSSDIWMRTMFTLDDVPANPYLSIHHDEDAEVYINGEEAAKLKGFTTAYQLIRISPAAAKKLHKGLNSIAIHCHQTKGGQYIDCGIVDIAPAK